MRKISLGIGGSLLLLIPISVIGQRQADYESAIRDATPRYGGDVPTNGLPAATSIRTAASANAQAAITWDARVEIASGGGYRGAWRQNESEYDYVDDSTVALDAEGNAVVAWVDQQRKDVFFQVYARDAKARFKTPANVSRTPKVFSWLPRLVLSPLHPKDIYVLWQEIVFSGGSHGGEIFFAQSRDGGATFREPLNLSNSINGDGKGRTSKESWHNGSLDLAIAPKGTLYAAWTEYDGPLWFSRSHDRGETFSKPMRVAGGGKAKPARAPALAVGSNSSVYLAWTVGEENGADIRVAKSEDEGQTFAEPTIAEKTEGYSDAPKIAVDSNGIVHVVHAESSGGPLDRCHVRYAQSRDGGRTFEPGREISRPNPQTIESASFPALTLDEQDNIYVLWEMYPNQGQHPRGLAISYSGDGGEKFRTPAIVPGSIDPAGGWNGSNQGLLMRKLAANGLGGLAVVNSSLKQGEKSRVWLIRGQLRE